MTIEDRIRELHAKRVTKKVAADLVGLTAYGFDQALEAMGLKWGYSKVGNVKINGVKDTWNNHAKRLGTNRAALRWRIRHGIPLDAPPMNQPVLDEEVDLFIKLRSEGTPAWEAALTVGRAYNVLRLQAKKRPGYEEMIAKLPRKRRKSNEIKPKEFLSLRGELGDEAA